jgi:hypothetical protein
VAAQIDEEIVKQQQDRYPLETCMVSGEKLGSMGDPINLVVGNRLVKICCAGCEKTVRANPAKYIDQLNKAAADAQRASYPLETCPVSGEKLGSMGEPVEVVYAGRLMKLCCGGCEEGRSTPSPMNSWKSWTRPARRPSDARARFRTKASSTGDACPAARQACRAVAPADHAFLPFNMKQVSSCDGSER